MNAKGPRTKPASQPIGAAQLHTPLARMLRPLVRLCIRGGMTFPALTQLLRELFVNVENLGNARVETGRSADGVVNVGTPRLALGGFRMRW